MNLKFLSTIVFTILLITISACQKEEIEENTLPNSSVQLEKSTYAPFELALIEINNLTIEDSIYSGSIDGVHSVDLFNIDNKLVFSVPDIIDGSHTLSCNLGGKDFNISFNSVSLSAIADPVLYVNNYLAEYNSLKNLNLVNADSLNPTDKFNLLADLQLVQNEVDIALNNFNNASASDKLTYARFLQANKQWMDDFKVVIDDFKNSMNQLKVVGVDDYELKTAYLIVQFEVSKTRFVNKAARLIATAGISFAFGPLVGSVTSGIALGLIINMVDDLSIQYAKIYENILIPFNNLIGNKVATINFDNGVKQSVVVTLDYRTIYSNDATSSIPSVTKIVTGMTQIKTAWNSMVDYLPFNLSFKPKEVSEIPSYTTSNKQVNSKYLTVNTILPSSIGCNIDRTNGDFKVTFTKQNLTAPQSFSFKIKYSAPDMGTVTGNVSALLNLGNDSLQIIQSMTGGGSRSWKDDPALVTQNCCGAYFTLDDVITFTTAGSYVINTGAQQSCPDSCEIDEGSIITDQWEIRKTGGTWFFYTEYDQSIGFQSSYPITLATDTRLIIGGIEFIRL